MAIVYMFHNAKAVKNERIKPASALPSIVEWILLRVVLRTPQENGARDELPWSPRRLQKLLA